VAWMCTERAPKGDLIQQLLSREEVVATPTWCNTWEPADVAVQVVQQVTRSPAGENFRNVVNLPFPREWITGPGALHGAAEKIGLSRCR